MRVSKLAVHGEALSVEIVCHVFAPAGLSSNETLTASGPAVVAVRRDRAGEVRARGW